MSAEAAVVDQKNTAKVNTKKQLLEDLSENPAVDEFFSRLNSEVRHPKPGDEAVAAVMEALQRLTTESDVEPVAENVAPDPTEGSACLSCGSNNRAGNRFCSNCGVPLSASPIPTEQQTAPMQGPPSVTPAPGQHHYHHHYHHHYFSDATSLSSAAPAAVGRARSTAAPASVREIGRPRITPSGGAVSRVEAAVIRVVEDWVLSCNTKHLDDLVALYVADGLVLRPNVPPVRGTAPIREFFFAALGSGFGEVEMEPLRLEVLGDVAYQAGRYKSLVPSVAGKRREERGKYSVVLLRQSNGEWRIACDCWSSDLNLPGEIESGPVAPHGPAREGKR
jgi:ketosteroid isomerase-like protein